MGKESEYPLEVKWIDVKHKGNLEDAFQIRRNVFINEQNVPEEEEFDEADLESHHAVVYADGSPVATGRLFKSEKYWIIGRISVLKEHRGKQAGKLVVEKLLEKAAELGAKRCISMHRPMQAGFTGSSALLLMVIPFLNPESSIFPW